jgi:hypothetical protein
MSRSHALVPVERELLHVNHPIQTTILDLKQSDNSNRVGAEIRDVDEILDMRMNNDLMRVR